jgi:hypothetical protein
MTGQEFEHDKKRLFSVMDRGFKVVVKKEGVDVRVVQRPTSEEPRSPAKASRRAEPAQVQMPVITGANAAILQLPGIRAIMAQLKPKEQQFFGFLLQNDGVWYSREKLPVLLGFATGNAMRKAIDFPRLVEKKWIECKTEQRVLSYRTSYGSR